MDLICLLVVQKMDFAVVEFPDENTVEVIPTKWIFSDQLEGDNNNNATKVCHLLTNIVV